MFQTTYRQINRLYYGCLCLGGCFLTGCGQLGIGEAEYGCRGMPSGVKCLSASEVYALTEEVREFADPPLSSSTNSLEAESEKSIRLSGRLKHYSSIGQIHLNQTMRSEAQMMRIWIAPWEDTDGSLHQGEFILTEIEGARWYQLNGR